MARVTKADLEVKIKLLEELLDSEKKTSQKLCDDNRVLQEQLASVRKIKNERGAGRKPTDEKIASQILEHRNNGMSLRAISKTIGVAVGTVHKIIKEHQKASKEGITKKE